MTIANEYFPNLSSRTSPSVCSVAANGMTVRPTLAGISGAFKPRRSVWGELSYPDQASWIRTAGGMQLALILMVEEKYKCTCRVKVC